MAKKDFMSLMKEKTVDVKPSLLSSEENIKRQLVILPVLRDLIPPLTDNELTQLEENIRKHGVKDPLTIWETTSAIAGIGTDDTPAYVLIDGHNRNEIIQKHQLDFRINLIQFDTLDEIKAYMIDYQLGRRNLTSEQASYLRGMRYNQKKSIRGSNLQNPTTVVNMAESLATEYGVSSRTIKRDGDFAAGLEQLSSTVKRDVLSGKLPKSTVQKLLKLESTTGPPPLGTSKEPLKRKDSKTKATVTDLENQIRALASKGLTIADCEAIIVKATELLDLLNH